MQGQITLELVVVSGRHLNSFKLSCMSSLPARMRLNQSKIKELECSQDSSIISLWGFFQTQSLVRSGQISNSSEMLWMPSLPASMKNDGQAENSITPKNSVLRGAVGYNQVFSIARTMSM